MALEAMGSQTPSPARAVPVMWPDVQALIVVPLSAHALFARPLVLSPRAHVELTVMPELNSSAVVWCDGRRSVDVEPGQRVEVVRGSNDLLIARLSEQPFADRLVRKFGLRVEGWRNMKDPQPSHADGGPS